jgi:hypothetical protein
LRTAAQRARKPRQLVSSGLGLNSLSAFPTAMSLRAQSQQDWLLGTTSNVDTAVQSRAWAGHLHPSHSSWHPHPKPLIASHPLGQWHSPGVSCRRPSCSVFSALGSSRIYSSESSSIPGGAACQERLANLGWALLQALAHLST